MTIYLAKFDQAYYGLIWVYKNAKGETLEVICNSLTSNFSFGVFEVRPSWRKPTDPIGEFNQPKIIKDLDFNGVSDILHELDRRDEI